MTEWRGFDGWPVPQRRKELDAVIALMRREGVRRYLEIGLRRATTFHYVGERLPAPSTMVGVDLPGGPWGTKDGSGEAAIDAAARDLRSRFGHDVMIVLGDSTDTETIDRAAERAPYDLIFIDGDHSPAGVEADWKNYGPMGRLIAFHDIDTPNAPGIREEKLGRYGVHILWDRIRAERKHREFIDPDDRGMGIGVLWR